MTTGLIGLAFTLALLIPEGTLIVSSQPDAAVLWDGVSIGRVGKNGTMRISGIPLGEYRITVETGFGSRHRMVRIAEGQQRVNFELVELAGSAPESPEPVVQDSSLSARPPPAEPLVVTEPVERAGTVHRNEESVTRPEIGAREERASQLARSTGPSMTPWVAYTLLGVLFVSLGILLSRRLASLGWDPGAAPMPHEPGISGKPPIAGSDEPGTAPALSESGQVAFLNHLKQREAQVQAGVEIIIPDERLIIDVTPESVREAEDS